MTPIPVVIDTDAGTDVDDALALALALASPEIDLRGVTIVDGDVNLRARIVARLLGQLGRPDIPVVPGSSQPLGPGRMPTMRGHEGRGILDVDYNGPEAVILDQGAAEWLVELSHQLPVHAVAIGPYTNIARALQLDPALAQRLTHLTVMGGTVDASRYTSAWKAHFARNGITGAWLDHNSASDPEAALICATSGVPMTWVTAELTFCTPIFEAAIDAFSTTKSIPGETLARLLRVWADEMVPLRGTGPIRAIPVPSGVGGLPARPARARLALSRAMVDDAGHDPGLPRRGGSVPHHPQHFRRNSVGIHRSRRTSFRGVRRPANHRAALATGLSAGRRASGRAEAARTRIRRDQATKMQNGWPEGSARTYSGSSESPVRSSSSCAPSDSARSRCRFSWLIVETVKSRCICIGTS